MDYTINLLWVIIAALGLLVTLITMIIKYNREAERFESWLKTHEKEINELKRSNGDMQHNFNTEHRRLESLIGGIAVSIGQIDTKLQLLLTGRIKNNNPEEQN